MSEILKKQELNLFKNYLSNCVNTTYKTYQNKEFILNNSSPIKKQIGFIEYGNAKVIKTDIEGKTTIIKELRAQDIFSNLFLLQNIFKYLFLFK